MLYEIKWSRFDGYTDYQGYTIVEATTVSEAEREFFAGHKEMNPYKGNFTGYCIEDVTEVR